jgi:uncharacterized caspase-like protein
MLRAAARVLVSVWLLAGVSAAAEPAQPDSSAFEIALKTSEAPGAPAGEKIKLYSASKALVIGIDNYSAGWPKLSGAINDAKAVAEALKLQGFSVTLITDPTAAGLRQAFEDFFITNGADPDARLFVWFAGHGHTIKGGGGEDEGYIVPRDAPAPGALDTEFRRTAISLRRFGEYMREARAKHVLAVFDSCFGGTVFNVARALPPQAITHAIKLPVRQFISSGDTDQQVSDDGTFRRLFVDALQGAEPSADINKDGYLTGTGLGQFLYNKMTNLTYQRQTPRYGKLNARGYDRGDFVFQVREPKTVAALKPLQVPSEPVMSEAARAWAEVKETKDVVVLDAFRKQFGAANPYYDTLAARRIEELKRAQTELSRPAIPRPEAGRPQQLAALKLEPEKPATTAKPVKETPKPEKPKGNQVAAVEPAPKASKLTTAEKPLEDAAGRAASSQRYEDAALRLIRTFTGHTREVYSVAISPDGRFVLSGSCDVLDQVLLVFPDCQKGSLKLWDLSTGRELRSFTGHTGKVKSVAFSPDGRFAFSGSTDKTLKMWDIASGRELRSFTGHEYAVDALAISRDGRFAIVGSGYTLKLWDIASGRELWSFEREDILGRRPSGGGIESVAISPDGRAVLAGYGDSKLMLWDIDSGRWIRTFEGQPSTVSSVAFSPDGLFALSGSSDATLKLWDVTRGQKLRTFTGHGGSVASVAISPDGRFALSGSHDSKLKLWDLASGRELHSFEGHTGFFDFVYSVAISPDGRFVLSGGKDKTLKLWDISEWTQPQETRR